jgi:hypothetical protein
MTAYCSSFASSFLHAGVTQTSHAPTPPHLLRDVMRSNNQGLPKARMKFIHGTCIAHVWH